MEVQRVDHSTFVHGAISSNLISQTIARYQYKKTIGSHTIFLGQVRADTVNDKHVVAIEYTAYEEMADREFHKIRESGLKKFNLTSIYIYHSIGIVKAGEISLFVVVSSRRRADLLKGLEFVVEAIKARVPVFGKEIFEDNTTRWKANT